IHAKQRNAIGGTPGSLAPGTHMLFDDSAGKPIELIQSVSATIGSLTSETVSDPAGPANVAEVAFFTHGDEKSIGLGKDGWMGGASVASALGIYATPSVQILVYGCSAAGGADSFARTLATALAKAGHSARVFGHTSSGHATVNANGREFDADP